MQFNKKEFKKVNDKKVMKKVKKQWVTVSISTLAFLGAAAVGTMMSLSDVSANDSVSAQSESSQSSVGVKEGSSNDGTLQGLSDKGDTNKNEDTATDASTPKNDNDALKNQSNNLNNNASQDLSTHNESHPIHVSNNLSVTQPDVHTDNKSGVPLNSEAKSGYIDGLNGSKNSADSNSDYSNAYGSAQTNKNVIDQAASDAYNNTNQVASSLSSNEQSLYNATSQGVNDARTQYNNGTSSFGTNEDYSSYNPSSAGSLNSSAATSYAHAQTKSYEDSLTSKYNNASNHSVRLQDGQTIVIPNSDSAQDTTYTADSDLDLAYKYGFNYFLAHQGYSDAESGKWTGTSDKNKGVAADNYNPSSDSTNPYDQAYLGAKNAMSKQWTYDATIVTPNSQTVTYTNGTITGYNNNIVNSNADKNNNYYNLGFNDVAKKVKNGNAFANNQYELNYLLTSIPVQKAINPGDKVEYAIINKNNPYGYSYNYFLNGLNKISIVNDIDFSNEASNTGNVYNYIYNSGGFNLTIDGQNHIADFSTLTTSFEHSGTLIEKNFKTTYSNNDYGVYKFENGGVDAGSLYLSNVNFIGSQILSATNTDVYISGSVNSINVKSINTPFEQNISVLNPDQENFEVNNLILAAGANFFGVTDKNSNSSVIHMYGNMTLGVGSNMTIIPRGSSGGSNANGAAYGIYMESSSTLSVNKNAILNIVPDYTSLDNNTAMASGIDSYGTINVTGGTINILVDGTPYNGGAEPIVNWSSSVININDGGSLNINVNDTNPSYGYDGTKGLIYSDGRINVYDGGNLRLTVQGGNRLTYILKQNTSNYLSVNNPGQIIFDSSTNTNTGNMVVYNQNAFNAYSVRYKIGSDSLSDPVYKFSYNTNGTNSNTYSYVDSNGQLSSTNQMSIPSGAAGPNYLEIDGVPSAYFVGPLDVEDDDNNDGGKKVTAYAKIRNYDPNASDSHVYVQYATGNNDTNYTGLNPIIDVWNYRNSIDSDHNMYDIVYDLKKNNYKDGQIIKIIFDIPASHMTGNNDVGVLMRYGVAGNSTVQNITSTSKGTDNYGNNLYGQYNQEAQNITSQNNGQSNQLVLDSNPNQTINIKNGWTSLFDTGTSDGINDGYFDDVINEKKNMVDYQRNIDYTRAYDSAKNGYNEFLNNTNEDLNTAISHAGDDVSSPISYIKGFEQAQQDVQKTRTAADTDARKNTNNYQNYYGQVRQIYLDEYNGLVIKDAINAAKSNFGDMVDETVGGSKYSSNEVAYKAYNDEYKSLADTAAQAKADYEGGKSSAAYSGANEDLYTSIYGAMSQAATDYNSGNGSNASGSHGYNSQIANYYTSAYTDLTNAASQASVDLGKNNGSDASYASGNSAASLAYSQAYSNVSSAAAQAKSDFQKSGQSLSHSYTTNSSAASTAYQAAYNAYSKAVSDFDGGSGSKQSSIAGYTSANYSAYASEYDALNKNAQDGSLAGFTSGASTSSSGDKAADTAYENAYNNAKQLVNNAYAIIDAEVKATKASIASDSRLDTAA
ncbi:hypothetical protein, partial [Apilactobacillus xinyiensis]|uniref:hypothetical protein n=1 Tax=Apilactobacillus xinyiensis TaxID=2841032 RepID=UPI003D161770|nr:hypothetical protein [Apilactobacillus xinyiensis]